MSTVRETDTRSQAPGVWGNGSRPRLHLLLAVPTYHPFYSGAGERFRRYLPGFRKWGIQVSVLTATPVGAKGDIAEMGNGWRSLPEGVFLPVEDVDGVPVHRVRLRDRPGRRRAAAFARSVTEFCRRADDRPDVVQLFTPALSAVPELHRLRRMGVPTVAARTMMPELPGNPLRRVLARASIGVPSRFVDCQVVGSRAMLEAYRRAGIRGRVEVIPHGVDLERFRPPRTPQERLEGRRRLGIPDQATVLLFVGAPSRRKGIDRLLAAWGAVGPHRSDLHLLLVGPRWKEGAPEGEVLARALRSVPAHSGARERIHFAGVVPDVETYMRASDVLAFPSNREGMPNVVLEAMASGLPAVLSPFSGLSPELGHPGTHYVLSGREEGAFAHGLAALLDAPDRRASMGRWARLWTERRLDVNRTVERYASLYGELGAGAREAGGRWGG